MSVVSSIFEIFTEILEWFSTALSSISTLFYSPEAGLTFVGTLTVIGLGIGVVTMIIAMIRSLLKGRG